MTTTEKNAQIKQTDTDKELLEIEAQIEALEMKKAERLKSAIQYVQSGKSFRPILYSHTDVINGKLARVNVLGDKIDQAGNAVQRQPRKTQPAKKARK